MHIAILELLADGASRFRRTGGLERDGFNELGNPGEIVFLVCFRCEVLDRDRHGRVGLLLQRVLVAKRCRLGVTWRTCENMTAQA